MRLKPLQIHCDMGTLRDTADSISRNVLKANIDGHFRRFYDTAEAIFGCNVEFIYKSICYNIADRIHLSVDESAVWRLPSEGKNVFCRMAIDTDGLILATRIFLEYFLQTVKWLYDPLGMMIVQDCEIVRQKNRSFIY